MKHSPSQSLFSASMRSMAQLRLLALACGLFLFMGTSAYGQAPGHTNATCASNPITLTKAYAGYSGITNETAAMYSWCRNETLTNIQSYCANLMTSIESVTNFNALTDGCKAEYLRRKQELDVIQKLSRSRH
jgi:hypothetical protein